MKKKSKIDSNDWRVCIGLLLLLSPLHSSPNANTPSAIRLFMC